MLPHTSGLFSITFVIVGDLELRALGRLELEEHVSPRFTRINCPGMSPPYGLSQLVLWMSRLRCTLPRRGSQAPTCRKYFRLMLLTIAFVWIVLAVVGAGTAWHRAPAVSLALLGSVVGGIAEFVRASADGPRGVPLATVGGATLGLIVMGLVGLLVARGKPPAALLRRAALGVAVVVPLVVPLVAVLLVSTCPLYVRQGAGYCFHTIDIGGGWITQVVLYLVMDLGALAALLLISARQARAAD